MDKKEEAYVKILFRFESDVLGEYVVETLWANTIDEKNGLYRVNSIPFYGPKVASDDVIFAEYDEDEEFLTFRRVVEHSGNSIIQVHLTDVNKNIDDIRNALLKLECDSEKVNDSYFSLEILASTDYKNIKQYLDELEQKGVISYAEPCLSDIHKNQVALTIHN